MTVARRDSRLLSRATVLFRHAENDVAVGLAGTAHGAEPVDEAPVEPNVVIAVRRALLLHADA